MFNRKVMSVLLACLLSSCSTMDQEAPSKPELKILRTDYNKLPGWTKSAQQQTLAAFEKTCARILKASPDKEFGLGTKMKDWQEACQQLPNPETSTVDEARNYFETWFTPYLATSDGDTEGLFTGYYEASLNGSPVQTGAYQTPLRARPTDLVMVNLGEFVPDLKGQRIAGRVKDGQLKPYEDRKQIETGGLPKEMDMPLYWVDSAVDAFFLQVQGSGVVTLPDGTTQRVGYDGQNGHPYTAIGKELIARGELTKDNVSMQSIRDWLGAHPTEAVNIMRTNKSYVFFKKLDGGGPVGAEGVVLTPEVSMAVDHSIWPYGVPMYIHASHPQWDTEDIQKLMVAQDTGGAIRGVIRGDFFWGYGPQAAANAGPMKSEGTLWVLLPKASVPHVEE